MARTRQLAVTRRREAKPWKAWYSLAIWTKHLRPAQLAAQPLCERCLAKDPPIVTAADTVHHKTPHRGDWALFVGSPLESVCEACHSIEIQREERVANDASRG